jgi:putative endonuclease
MFIVYVLKSLKNRRFYIGQTQDINERLRRHNFGKVKSTKHYRPWEIIYSEDYQTRSESCRRERQIKKYKGGEAFYKLINHK